MDPMVAGGLPCALRCSSASGPWRSVGPATAPECSSTVHCSAAPPAGLGWPWVFAFWALTGAIVALGVELLFQRWQRGRSAAVMGTRVAASLDHAPVFNVRGRAREREERQCFRHGRAA